MPLWFDGNTTATTVPIWLDTVTNTVPRLWVDTGTATSTTTTTWPTLTTSTGTTAITATPWWDDMTPQEYMGLAQNRAVTYRRRTAQERIELAEQQRIAAEHHARMAEQRRLATARSRELLLAHLTKEQRKTFESKSWFVVEGGSTRRRYRINGNSFAGNICVLDGNLVTHRLCCHCSDAVPIYDHLLAQKLHLQYDEDAFLRIANRQAA